MFKHEIMLENKENIKNTQLTNPDLYEVILDLSRKINEIHQLHFSQQKLKTRKNQKRQFLAEILISPARKTKVVK